MQVIALLAIIFGVFAQLLLCPHMTGIGIGCGVVAALCNLPTIFFAGGGEEGNRERFWGMLMAATGVLLIIYCAFNL